MNQPRSISLDENTWKVIDAIAELRGCSVELVIETFVKSVVEPSVVFAIDASTNIGDVAGDAVVGNLNVNGEIRGDVYSVVVNPDRPKQIDVESSQDDFFDNGKEKISSEILKRFIDGVGKG